MEISIDTLPPDGELFSLELSEADVWRLWDDPAAARLWRIDSVRADIRLMRAHGGVEAQGHLASMVTGLCRRCTTSVAVEIDEAIGLRFERGPHGGGHDAEVELDEASLDVVDLDSERIDLAEIAAEQLAIALTSELLCRPDCAGLCSQCGQDLNEQQCRCKPETDPRWSALADLKK